MSRAQGAAGVSGRSAPAIAVLVDYDGTIATVDVTDELVRSASSEGAWWDLELAYRRGEIGSRQLLEAETRLLPRDAADLPALAMDQPHDSTFAPFVEYARQRAVPVEVVSDGLGFFVRPALDTLGLADLPVFAATLAFESHGPTIAFPDGHPVCRVCGTCKRERVLAHQSAGRHVAYVGDGYSDRYAVAYADTVFAKGDLAEICWQVGIPFRPWSDFDDIRGWLHGALDDEDPGGPVARPFICGPESPGAEAAS